MPCYSPIKLYEVGLNENGKKRFAVSKLRKGDNTTGFILAPCGCCIGCRIDYARQWADRCMLESMDHEESHFLTLTYDEDNLDTVTTYYGNKDSGEAEKILTLNKRDLQLFHKSLRKELDKLDYPKIRFFACGEYGSPEKTMRPHFHDIVFGLKLTDLKEYDKNKLGQILYTSKFLNDIWKKGQVIVGDVTWQSCAYVSRYVTKKLKGESAELYKEFNLTPPFVIMSRKPGIAYNYYKEHPELFDFNYFSFGDENGSKKIYPPRYFKQRLQIDDPEKYKEVSERMRLASEIKFNSKKMVTELDIVDQFAVDESLFNDRLKTLVRNGV